MSVSGIGKDSISLVFGENGNEAEYANLAAIGAFAPFTTQTIYKLAGEGFLA